IIKILPSITYRFLSSKDKNIYILPEIIFNLSLILSPYIFLLGLLFIDYTFKRVNSKEILISIKYNELLLLLNLALDNIPINKNLLIII
ncbi:C2H2 finger domain protein, partial [Penicillium paradoxum]|uniref:C2H2 finger domain protein n=1 Tax=Penicillium paradoxum TaxID=176176 RepID=UPI00254925FE